MVATVRSTRRRLIYGTGAPQDLNYALLVGSPVGTSFALTFFDPDWNVVGIEATHKSGACFDPGTNVWDRNLLLSPTGDWYYACTGSQGSSQRTNMYGYRLPNNAADSLRYLPRLSTAVTELGASGVTESYSSTSAGSAMHPSGDFIANLTGANNNIKFWKKVSVTEWTYMGALAIGVANQSRIEWNADGTLLVTYGSSAANMFRIWRVDSRDDIASGYTACTTNYAPDTLYTRFGWWDGTDLWYSLSSSPWARKWTRTSSTVWDNSGTSILTGNPTLSAHMGTYPKFGKPNAARTILLLAANSATANKGHWLHYKVAGSWVYQGQLPGTTVSATTVPNWAQWTADDLYLVVGWASGGVEVWSSDGSTLTYVKRLEWTTGVQNNLEVNTTTNLEMGALYTQGGYVDPAGTTEIDTAIASQVNPYYWWKLNEWFDVTSGLGAGPMLRNSGQYLKIGGGSSTAGNIMLADYSGGAANVLSRQTGPPSATASYAVRFNASSSRYIAAGQGTIQNQIGTTGTVAFFVKYTQNSASKRQLFSDQSIDSGAGGMHFMIQATKLMVRCGSSGASARTLQSVNAHNDGNWHFVCWQQPADGTGMKLYVDNVLQTLTVNPGFSGDSGTSAALINHWFPNNVAGRHVMLGANDSVAVQFDICHVFITPQLLTSGQMLTIKQAAGL